MTKSNPNIIRKPRVEAGQVWHRVDRRWGDVDICIVDIDPEACRVVATPVHRKYRQPEYARMSYAHLYGKHNHVK